MWHVDDCRPEDGTIFQLVTEVGGDSVADMRVDLCTDEVSARFDGPVVVFRSI